MKKVATYDLDLCVHARNALNEALCGHAQSKGELLLTDKSDEITCTSCEVYKKFHRSQMK